MLTPEAAWLRLEPHLGALPAVRRDRRAALGRVLAEEVTATADLPAADVSAMDGFALTGDVAPGTLLPVTATVAAGAARGVSGRPGQAIRIMTGAVLPHGTDRVVPVEDTEESENGVRVRVTTARGAHVRRRAEIVGAGDSLLPAGAIVTPAAASLLASQGIGEVGVHRDPRVAILVTGDEVVAPDRRPRPGQLRDAHSDFLLAELARLAVGVEHLGIAPDAPRTLRDRIGHGLAADVFLLSGGVSKGLFDLVPGLLEEAGCEVLFRGVAIQPGKPLLAATSPGGLVFGLPGNPGSVMTAFWLFVRPVLRRLLGIPDGFWTGALRGELLTPLPAGRSRERFLPATLLRDGARLLVDPIPPAGSHDLVAFARASGLARIPAGSPALEAGAHCEVLALS